MTYDPSDDARKSYAVAIAALRVQAESVGVSGLPKSCREQIIEMAKANPEMPRVLIAKTLGCTPAYVSQTLSLRYPARGNGRAMTVEHFNCREILERLFLAIIEEGHDVESAINAAEQFLYGNAGAPEPKQEAML